MMPTDEDRQFERLKDTIQQHGGLDCRCYKINYLKRRLAVRMRATGLTTYGEYNDLLRRDPKEYDILLDRLTINVSHFFRDLDTFKAVERQVLPELAKRRQIRIWSAGCANGEEPYTLAMLAEECLTVNRRYTILATDIDMGCLMNAQAGVYKETAMQEIPFSYRQKYFENRGESWAVVPKLKTNVSFTRLDLTGRLLPGPYDLIVCRNVMIYFNRQLQERLLKEFHQLLSPDGFLVLGKTEVLLAECRSMFRAVNLHERIYQYQEPALQ